MGADNSKENNRSNKAEQSCKSTPRRQYVPEEPPAHVFHTSHQTTTQRAQQNLIERSRTPSSATTELPNTAKKANQPNNVLERTRQPYNFNNENLQNAIVQVPQRNLYPNLSRSEENFVVVSNHVQQRSTPKPSAPPASEMYTLPQTQPAQTPFSASLNAPGPSNTANSSAVKGRPTSGVSLNAPGPSNTPNSSAIKGRPTSVVRGPGNKNKLSCPTCSQPLGVNIFQCSGGHSSCKDCRFANRPCGTCRSPITEMRNIMLEAYIRELKSPCQNNGCTLRFNADDMERHFKECPFGEMDCPMGTFFGTCPKRCKVADMADHFDVFHKEQRTAEIGKEMYLFNICMETRKMYLIKNGPFNFLVHVKVGEKERRVYMTVQLLGTKISAVKWTYEFHVYNKSQPSRKFLYVDSCQSIGTPIDDIYNTNQCATLPLTFGMTFVNESSLTYKFFIKKEMNRRVRKGGPRNEVNTEN